MTGFIAGMPFLGDVNKQIRLERLGTPRVKVPKGAVGITEQFTNIYTFSEIESKYLYIYLPFLSLLRQLKVIRKKFELKPI